MHGFCVFFALKGAVVVVDELGHAVALAVAFVHGAAGEYVDQQLHISPQQRQQAGQVHVGFVL